MIDDLLAPLDMARFALAFALLIMTPGYALATLLRPRSCYVERLALAMPCGYALLVLCGLCTALAHLPFSLPVYLSCAAPVTVYGGYVLWRDRQSQPWRPVSWAAIPLGVGLLQAALLLVSVRRIIPAVGDIISHVIWTNLIARSHVFPIALLSSHAGATDGAFYPPAFHAATALILAVAPMQTYHAVFYSLMSAVALLPLGLFCYVRVATGSARIGAFAALAALAFGPLPLFVGAEGLDTFTVVQVFVPALAIAIHAALGRGERGAVVLAALIGIGFFYTHPTEFVTAGLLVAAIVPARLRSVRTWTRACGYGVVIALAWLIAAAPALVAVRRTMVDGAQAEIHGAHDFAVPSRIDFPAILTAYVQWIYDHNLSYLLLAAVVAGTFWGLTRRRYLNLIAVQAIVVALALDSESYNLLRPFYELSFPWALWERIAATHYWFVLPVAALGIDAAARHAWRMLDLGAKRISFVAFAAAPIVVAGLLLPLCVSAWRANVYASASRITSESDRSALLWLGSHGSPKEVVANDTNNGAAPMDSSMSLPIVGGPQPLFARLSNGPGTAGDRIYLVRHIADDPLPPRALRYIESNDVRYVYYGSRAPASRGREGQLNLMALLSSPHLRLAYSGSGSCPAGIARTMRKCPPTDAYVFMLQPLADAHAHIARAARPCQAGSVNDTPRRLPCRRASSTPGAPGVLSLPFDRVYRPDPFVDVFEQLVRREVELIGPAVLPRQDGSINVSCDRARTSSTMSGS